MNKLHVVICLFIFIKLIKVEDLSKVFETSKGIKLTNDKVYEDIEDTKPDQYKLAKKMYLGLTLNEKRDPKWISEMKKCGELGYGLCYAALGEVYYFGKIGSNKIDFCLAKYYFEMGSFLGDSTCHSYLGLMYSTGKCSKIDEQLAILHFHLGELDGNLIAKLALANKYYLGLNAPYQCTKGGILYYEAAKRNEVRFKPRYYYELFPIELTPPIFSKNYLNKKFEIINQNLEKEKEKELKKEQEQEQEQELKIKKEMEIQEEEEEGEESLIAFDPLIYGIDFNKYQYQKNKLTKLKYNPTNVLHLTSSNKPGLTNSVGEWHLKKGYKLLLESQYHEFSLPRDPKERPSMVGSKPNIPNGSIIGKHFQLATDFFRQGVKLNSSKAMVNLGLRYLLGIGVDEKNYTKAYELFSRATELKDPLGTTLKGVLTQNAMGTDRSLHEGIDLQTEGARFDVPQSRYYYGNLHYLGLGVGKNLKIAYENLLSSSKGGHLPSMYKLGIMISNGYGIEKQNCRESVKWLKLVAETSDQVPELFYAKNLFLKYLYYKKNQKIDQMENMKNLIQSVLIYEKFAKMGYVSAMINTGYLYQHYVSDRLFSCLFNNNNIINTNKRNRFTNNDGEKEHTNDKLLFKDSNKINKAKYNLIIQYYQNAATLQSTQAMIYLAEIYNSNDAFDPNNSLKWYIKACNLGNVLACWKAGWIYQKNIHIIYNDNNFNSKHTHDNNKNKNNNNNNHNHNYNFNNNHNQKTNFHQAFFYYSKALKLNSSSFPLSFIIFIIWTIDFFINRPLDLLQLFLINVFIKPFEISSKSFFSFTLLTKNYLSFFTSKKNLINQDLESLILLSSLILIIISIVIRKKIALNEINRDNRNRFENN
ncbi:sel1l adaptor subunit of erad e3 ubiquitin ligase [Anaeramoeba flamelloides]|uniref:Sel1l adaptor subunit of erad e3 ubiquitin ligase n=1 Tax=Anaeramoeba flamelloides TaxID=1746091 RepID=A0ABQ8X900_9EUKA|nr:sel1l adaptor subunit of erad e3 ubiquitin ligase [Anaeramoeba flamelloides]